MKWAKMFGSKWPRVVIVRVAGIALIALAIAAPLAAAAADIAASGIACVGRSTIPLSRTTAGIEVRPLAEQSRRPTSTDGLSPVVDTDLGVSPSVGHLASLAPKRGAIIEANRARGAALRERWGHLSAAERRTLLTTKKIGNAYQGFYREACQYWSARGVSVRPGQNATTVLGQRIDARARLALIDWAESQGLGEAQGLFINRRLYDYVGSGRFRIPDVRYEPGMMIWDGTIGHKTPFTPQVQDFSRFSRGYDVRIVTPW